MSSGGIERKWLALNDERQELREENDRLRGQVARLLAEQQSAEDIRRYGLSLNEDEAGAMDALLFAYRRITKEWELIGNSSELTAAMHVIQGFIVQHMLQRLAPDRWGVWWNKTKEKENHERVEAEVHQAAGESDPERPAVRPAENG